ncbi:magnesium-dependent phosphatase-1 [Catenovulum sp. 2E275]|uniref:magnesium-dependent phosphatase-1 n=1 Tax=Catenovulum sp. 2E275 TaxID=2980497 RepID=UPI0021D0B60E|nr:magnesium-dependent phosphatase-1 [Catenovulum sp. 2E275]MCU4675226.1 magnesium-dependent phosphatase-1 [Catenovulum sp. 2E275]
MSVELIVFDLDFTLWDCDGVWCDCTCPPYKKHGNLILDSQKRSITLYSDVIAILQYCQKQQIKMALASRTGEPSWAKQLIELFDIQSFFIQQEIYPGSKVNHFQMLKQNLNIDYGQMVFFDDEMRNIKEVGDLGVKAVFVETGLNWDMFTSAIQL